MSDPGEVESAAKRIEQELGPLDVWINNAVVSVFARLPRIEPAEYKDSCVRITMVQLPAVNTPQFDHVRSRLPRRAQPVPPIFQPEVAARAVEWASRHDRPELWVGGSTAWTVAANRVAPRPLDRYLGWMGVEAQQTDEPEDPGRPDNLWEPVPGDPGARGRFDERARDGSLQLEATLHRGWLALGALALAAGIGAVVAATGER